VNWNGPDLRGRIFKDPAPSTPRFMPWLSDISARPKHAGRYTKKADRPTSRDWNFRVHLDQQELAAAFQYHHDWALAGLRPRSSSEWLEPSNNDDLAYGGQVLSKDHYAEAAGDDHHPILGSSSTAEVTAEVTGEFGAERGCEEGVVLSADDLRAMATPKTHEEALVKRLVDEYTASGGTIKVCPPFMTTRRDSAKQIVEWVIPSGTPIRSAAVCDQPHAIPLNWFQARHRRIHRFARRALLKDEASLIEAVVLRGEATDSIPLLKAALQRLAKHYATFVASENFGSWKDRVSSNFEHAIGAAAA